MANPKRTLSRSCSRSTSVLLALALTGGGLATLGAAPASAAPGDLALGAQILGLSTTNTLVPISNTTGAQGTAVTVTGLTGGDDLVGIDYRPATGQLVGVARTSADTAAVYTISPTGAASGRIVLTTSTGGVGSTVPLLATDSVAVDVNPTNNLLRLIIGDVNYSVDGAGVATAGTAINPNTADLGGVAYSNSTAGAATTTLYGIDTAGTDQLVTIANPNGGAVVNQVALGVNATGAVGFDINSADNNGFASLTVGASTGLYSINTAATTGAAAAAIGGGATLTGIEDITIVPGTGPVFTAADVSVAEGGTATVTVTRSGDTTSAATVNYATSGTGVPAGTATSGTDFTATNGTLSFAAGETTKTFTVATTTDTTDEPNEVITVTLSAPSAGVVAGPSKVTIVDANGPTFTVSSASVEEGGLATFTVTRSINTGADTVKYAVASGTATSGTDFTAASGTLSFAAGETTKQFTVQTTADGVTEGSETATVTLSEPSRGTVGAAGSLTITDAAATFTVNSVAVTEGGAATVTVTRAGSTAAAANVTYTTSNGTAVAGVDYTTATGTLNFAIGEATKTFTVQTTTDAIDEPNETVNVTLSAPSTGSVGAAGTVTIVDANAPTFTVDSVTAAEGATATFTVTRTNGTAAGTVAYQVTSGTAVAGSDFTAASGTLSFAAGETTKTFTVATLTDTATEGNETATVTLSSPSRGTVGAAGTLTITDATTQPPAQAATSVTLQSTPRVRFPAAPVLTGTLRDANGAPLADRIVNVIYKQQSVAGLAAFRPVLALRTDANGNYTGTIRPTVNAVFQAIYLGNESEAASGSGYAVTKVQVANPTVNGFGSTLTVRANTRVNITGRVLPGNVQSPVTVQWIRPDGIFNVTPLVRANALGNYSVARTYAPGTYKLRVLAANTASNLGSASRTITLRVVR